MLSMTGTRSWESVKMEMGSSSSTALKLSSVRPEYFLARFFLGSGMASSSTWKRLRATAAMLASFSAEGCLRLGVLAGVGRPIKVARVERVSDDLGAIPSEWAAVMVLSAVNWPDTRRTESGPAIFFFLGDGAGDVELSW